MVPDSNAVLQSAVAYGSIESVDILVAHGAVPHKAQPVHSAVKWADAVMLLHVLELGADVNEVGHGEMMKGTYGTPLLRAIKRGKEETVRALLEEGGSMKMRGRD
jgi:ankyrin repeat protein